MTISSDYIHCADEGGTCKISGKKSVAYVNKDRSGLEFFSEHDADVTCNAATLASYDKTLTNTANRECLIRDIPTYSVKDMLPVGYTKCAAEGATCNPNMDRPVNILYGGSTGYEADTAFIYAGTKNIICEPKYFNTVPYLHNAACYYYAEPVPPSPATAPGPAPTEAPAGVDANSDSGADTGAGADTDSPTKKSKTGLYIGLGIGAVIIIILFIILLIYLAKRKK